nr:glycosyltransferase [Oenococcus oeni]
MSRYTDTLITIDKEEYDIARKHFDANRVVLIPGVGVDVVGAIAFSLEKKQRIRENTRCVLGLSDGDFAILSVGELSHRKNQEVILRAVAKLHNPRIKILVAGVGPLKSYLINLAKQLGISHQLQLLGYRNDLRALHFATDLFVFPSLREGLALAGLEAIVDGERIIGANIRGIRDYIIPSCGTMCQPRNIRQISELILDEMQPNRLSRINDKDIQNFFSSFDCGAVDSQMRDCYVLYAAK